MDAAWAFFNGAWIPTSEIRIGVHDVGFLLGVAISERLRTFRHEVFRLNDHLCRLRRSAEIVGLDADQILGEVASAISEFVARNRGQIADDDDWSITVFVTPGSGPPSRPTVCVHGFPLLFQKWARQYESGLPVVISDIRQVPPDCWPPELKCRSRMHYYLADLAAAAKQPGARPILLDENGDVAESTTANVLVFRTGEGIVTPPARHILAGVSLGVAKEVAGQIGLPFISRALRVEELRAADEIMLASTSICLLPVVSCDGAPIGDGKPGPIFRRLLAAWGELVGVDIGEQARCYAAQREAP